MEYHIYEIPYMSTFSLNMDFGEANKFRKNKQSTIASLLLTNDVSVILLRLECDGLAEIKKSNAASSDQKNNSGHTPKELRSYLPGSHYYEPGNEDSEDEDHRAWRDYHLNYYLNLPNITFGH
ncbi:hypothetical protein [Vibrio tetraodonis]|uniref:hypothetical protein n=1 Tax=Vibrio tetraodonis TaxID=2231647 RepID=UPI000E0BA37E|nr:hypothetical protein [Vibrio tetraodonis]